MIGPDAFSCISTKSSQAAMSPPNPFHRRLENLMACRLSFVQEEL